MSSVLKLKAAEVTRVQKAVAYLRRSAPLRPMAALLATMRLYPDPSVPMAGTDAVRKVFYNPAYMESLSTIEAVAALVHEALHKFGMFFVRFEAWAARHGSVTKPADQYTPAEIQLRMTLLRAFNEAQDYLINYSIKHDWNLPIQDNWLYKPELSMDVISAEVLADTILKDKQQQQQGSGAGKREQGAGDMSQGDDICLPDEYRAGEQGKKSLANVPSSNQLRAMEAEARRDLATAVRYAGGMEAGKEKFTLEMHKEVTAPTASLARELNRLAARLNREGHTAWQRPHRWRKLPNGIGMPGPKDVKLGTIVLIRDTSGSTSGKAAQYFLNTSLKTLSHVAFDKVVLMDVSNHIVEDHIHTFTQADVKSGKVKREMPQGGGTAFAPAFEWIAENVRETPAAIVYLTDGGTTERDVERCHEIWSKRRCPVLWALIPGTHLAKRFAGWVTSDWQFGQVSYLPADKT